MTACFFFFFSFFGRRLSTLSLSPFFPTTILIIFVRHDKEGNRKFLVFPACYFSLKFFLSFFWVGVKSETVKK